MSNEIAHHQLPKDVESYERLVRLPDLCGLCIQSRDRQLAQIGHVWPLESNRIYIELNEETFTLGINMIMKFNDYIVTK